MCGFGIECVGYTVDSRGQSVVGVDVRPPGEPHWKWHPIRYLSLFALRGKAHQSIIFHRRVSAFWGGDVPWRLNSAFGSAFWKATCRRREKRWKKETGGSRIVCLTFRTGKRECSVCQSREKNQFANVSSMWRWRRAQPGPSCRHTRLSLHPLPHSNRMFLNYLQEWVKTENPFLFTCFVITVGFYAISDIGRIAIPVTLPGGRNIMPKYFVFALMPSFQSVCSFILYFLFLFLEPRRTSNPAVSFSPNSKKANSRIFFWIIPHSSHNWTEWVIW